MKKLQDISLIPVQTEIVSPERFLRIYAEEKDSIESAKPLPNPLGSKVLGRIQIIRKRPVYMPLPDKSSDIK